MSISIEFPERLHRSRSELYAGFFLHVFFFEGNERFHIGRSGEPSFLKKSRGFGLSFFRFFRIGIFTAFHHVG